MYVFTEEEFEAMDHSTKLWRQLQSDFASLEDNEDILITLNGRQYVVRPANSDDIREFDGYDEDGNYTSESE
jgi:hypothetical protein